MKRLLFVLFLLALGMIAAVCAIAGYGYHLATQPIEMPVSNKTDPKSPNTIRFRVEKGSGAAQIAGELAEQGFIKNALVFRIAARLMGADGKFKAGSYRIEGSQSPVNLVKLLVEGKTSTTTLVIAEGLNQWQIAEKIAAAFPALKKEDIEKEFSNPSLLALLPTEAKTVEGYLFPETYTLPEDSEAADILRNMILLFNEKVTPQTKLLAADQNLSLHELVTLASIIEKETGAPEERGLISGVFHNRLRRKMKLQTDPTVIYGMWSEYDGNIRKKDLLRPTPYNTYVIDGLPPGPIASPGLDALNRAARPEETDALYFVALGDGSGRHEFSRNLVEHNRAVRNFLDRLRKGRVK